MSIGKGIKLASGFDLNAKTPLDNRTVFETITERDSLPDINLYEGLMAYVKETKLNYQYKDGGWEELKTGSGASDDFIISELAKKSDIGHKHDDIYPQITTVYTKLEMDNKLSNLPKGGHYVGSNPPLDTEAIWIDTSGNSVDDFLDSLIIEELKAIITSLNNRLIDLEERVTILELTGGGSTPPTDNGNYIIMENGSRILLEDGSKLLKEE